MSHDDRQRIYVEKMSEFCEDVVFIEDESWGRELRRKLENVKLEEFYLASLDNSIALGIFSFAPMQFFTFDDGSTSLITPNMYTVNPSRVVSHNGMTLENVIELSEGHYTVFNRNTIFPVSKLIKMNFNVTEELGRLDKQRYGMRVFPKPTAKEMIDRIRKTHWDSLSEAMKKEQKEELTK